MTPEQYESLTTELDAAQAASIALTPRLLAGEKISQAEFGTTQSRLETAGKALYEAVRARMVLPQHWMG